MKAVVNASPLIFLAKLDRLDLLPSPCATTPVVISEIRAGAALGHPEAISLEGAIRSKAIVVRKPRRRALPEQAGLHPGETSVLALALQHKAAEVIVDDRIAIRIAKMAGLRPISTPFLILRATREGRLAPSTARGLLARLLGHGYFLSVPLYERLLKEFETGRR